MLARRAVLKTTATLPLAAVLADPVLARAQAAETEAVTLVTPSGRTVGAALALPATTPAPAVLLVHEWWGLNDQIRSMAVELSRAGYVALAVDLMNGQVATTPEQAQAQTAAVDAAEATETLVAWIDWLKAHPSSNGRIATMGWCFGGGWALNAALAAPVDATVVYYGQVPGDPTRLASLNGPVMGHFATQDQFIDKPMVDAFIAAMDQAGKPLEVFRYDANHAFANPTGGAYDQEDARTAWQRTLDFLDQQLRG